MLAHEFPTGRSSCSRDLLRPRHVENQESTGWLATTIPKRDAFFLFGHFFAVFSDAHVSRRYLVFTRHVPRHWQWATWAAHRRDSHLDAAYRVLQVDPNNIGADR